LILESKSLKYVITGGPGVGKTSIIRALSKIGFDTVPEAGRQIKETLITQPPNGTFNHSLSIFRLQMKILEAQLSCERKLPKNKIVFLDRGIPDGIAYFLVNGLKPPKKLMRISKNQRYDKIFLLQPLQIYSQDNIRDESLEKANRIQEMISSVYRRLEYEVISIPSMSLSDRLNYIFKHLK